MKYLAYLVVGASAFLIGLTLLRYALVDALDPSLSLSSTEGQARLEESGVFVSEARVLSVHGDPSWVIVDCKRVRLKEGVFYPTKESGGQVLRYRGAPGNTGFLRMVRLKTGWLVGLIDRPLDPGSCAAFMQDFDGRIAESG